MVFENEKHLIVDSHFSGEETGRRALISKDAPTFVQTEIPFDHEVRYSFYRKAHQISEIFGNLSEQVGF